MPVGRRFMPHPSSRTRATRPARRRPSEPSGYGFLTVGQTARILGVSPSTLRLWENVGLVSPVRSNGRYRLYSPDLLKMLKRIKYLRDVHRLNVPGIKRELGKTLTPSSPIGQRPVGPVLRRLRQRSGKGLVEAASEAGISAGFLSSLERSQANGSVATLQRLANTYGATLKELVQVRRCRAARRCCRPRSCVSSRARAAAARTRTRGKNSST
jgi:DNA-binding transcriptional MerR regulator